MGQLNIAWKPLILHYLSFDLLKV